jgi:hypothetical protein
MRSAPVAKLAGCGRSRTKRLFPLAPALFFSGYAAAQVSDAALDTYLQQVTGRPAQKIQAHIAEAKSPAGETLFGLVQVPIRFETEDSTAFVLVAREGPDHSLVELVRSKPFDFWSNGRHYVEIVESPAPGRFALQINYNGACTSGFDVFRFAQRGTAWIVAGRDSTRMNCGADDRSPGDSRSERSANFLTGTVIEVDYRRGKVKSRRTSHQSFPEFPVADFAPFSDVYGPR